MSSKWQIVKNSIKAELPPIQENKTSFADVVEDVTKRMKRLMHTDHLDTTLPQIEATDKAESRDINPQHGKKSSLKKSHSSNDFVGMMGGESLG